MKSPLLSCFQTLTIIFLVVIMTLKFFGLYAGMSFSITVLAAFARVPDSYHMAAC